MERAHSGTLHVLRHSGHSAPSAAASWRNSQRRRALPVIAEVDVIARVGVEVSYRYVERPLRVRFARRSSAFGVPMSTTTEILNPPAAAGGRSGHRPCGR